ncbi:hypothetical protein F5Y10DRAFT_228311 [Nemania abortiva]|nr:hypothetical protein F5Y10DRAFT_228311 [Nemania abortiva]
MAQEPGRRALAITRYFTTEHGFEPEKYDGGIVIYKRINDQGAVERIVVKHAELLQQIHAFDVNDEIEMEERNLRRLWGAEHIIRLLAIVDSRRHRPRAWREPVSRHLLDQSSILPWKIRVRRADHPGATRFCFFVMEYLSRGDALSLIRRCQNLHIIEISEPLLWYFALCLTRGCVAMAWPPNRDDRNPPPVEREQIPNPRPAASTLVHGDLHLGNIMFGDFDPRDDTQPSCHQGVPVLKIIDFNLAAEHHSAHEAQRDNIFHAMELIYQLATLGDNNLVWNNDDDRPSFVVDDIQAENFDTWLDEDFYRSKQYSRNFRLFLARCFAIDPDRRPTVRRALEICERHVARTSNWRHLADEVTEIFDTVPDDTDDDDDSDSSYHPPSDDSDDEDYDDDN